MPILGEVYSESSSSSYIIITYVLQYYTHLSWTRHNNDSVSRNQLVFFPSSSSSWVDTRKRWYLCRRDFLRELCLLSSSPYSVASAGDVTARQYEFLFLFFWNVFSRTLLRQLQTWVNNEEEEMCLTLLACCIDVRDSRKERNYPEKKQKKKIAKEKKKCQQLALTFCV